MKKLLVAQVAALDWDVGIEGMPLSPVEAVFPAVTCVAQASFRTAAYPCSHGMVANGVYLRNLRRPMFWEQSAALVEGDRIWRGLRGRGGRVASLFWQQSLGESADIALSPAPIHKHHGGMIMDCYANPDWLYPELRKRLGSFKLRHYWGQMARPEVGDWIVEATAAVINDPRLAPELCLTYLPTLDYDFQRHPSGHPRRRHSIEVVKKQLAKLTAVARGAGYQMLVFGDYRIGDVKGAAFPNRALRAAGLLGTRVVGGRRYPDLHASRAFALADHQFAHVYIPDPADIPAARRALEAVDGVAAVLERREMAELRVDHPNSGELLALAKPERWLAYQWWDDDERPPDYARHVDIHNKPGYDPCELFWGWPPGATSLDTSRIGGSHGLAGGGEWRTVFGTTLPLPNAPRDLVDLALMVRQWLDS